MRFDFATANRILFGAGVLEQAGSLAAEMGRHALVVSGYQSVDIDRLAALLKDSGLGWVRFPVSGEPSVQTVEEAVRIAREAGCDLVIGFGGGSAIDTAKAAAALITNPGSSHDYLEVVGKNQPLTERPAPFIAIPTTAGTGSEVTRNAVLSVPEKQVKVSLRSPMMLARAALIDPELTYTLPPAVTASTGMDALAQLIEPYVSKRANAFTDLYCREGIRRAARSLRRAYKNGQDKPAREDMSFASLMGGLALANAGLGAAHGFAGPIGGMFDAPHGAVCACLLPAAVSVNARALRQREPENQALSRYVEIAQEVTGNRLASADDLAVWLDDLRRDLNIPTLSAFGVKRQDLDILVEKGSAASSMKANPLALTREELREILEVSL